MKDKPSFFYLFFFSFIFLGLLVVPVEGMSLGISKRGVSTVAVGEATVEVARLYNKEDVSINLSLIWKPVEWSYGEVELPDYVVVEADSSILVKLSFNASHIGNASGIVEITAVTQDSENITGGLVLPAFDAEVNINVVEETQLEQPDTDTDTNTNATDTDTHNATDTDSDSDMDSDASENVTSPDSDHEDDPVEGGIDDGQSESKAKGGGFTPLLIGVSIIGGCIGGAVLLVKNRSDQQEQGEKVDEDGKGEKKTDEDEEEAD